MTEARAWKDFTKPDRQIIAPVNDESRQFCGAILELLPSAFFRFHAANSTEAELAKYGGNIFGAIKVTFANIWADFCDVLGVDYENVRKVIGHDSRIGGSWMDVLHGEYRGFGGFCFPKDLNAFIAFAEILMDEMQPGVEKRRLSKGLNILRAVWDYNKYLLFSQGLTIEDVSMHDKELEKKLKKEQGKND